jgi:hypothetical protein
MILVLWKALILSEKKNIKFTSCRWNQHDYRLRNSRRIWHLWERFRIPLKKFILIIRLLYYFKLIQNWTKNEPKTRQNKEIVHNGYALDFADVFNKAFENYKKIALYAGLMIFVFMVIFTNHSKCRYKRTRSTISNQWKSCPSIWKILAESISLTIRGINFILRSN